VSVSLQATLIQRIGAAVHFQAPPYINAAGRVQPFARGPCALSEGKAMSYSRTARRFMASKGLSALTAVRRNRKGIRRKLGLTSQAVQCAEEYVAMSLTKPRVTASDVARCLGLHRSQVSRHLKLCCEVGLLVKVGRTFVLMAKSVLSWSAEFAAQRRQHLAALRSKRFKSLTKSRFVAYGSTHTTKKDLGQLEGSETGALPVFSDRLEAVAQLAATYVPVHLRKSA